MRYVNPSSTRFHVLDKVISLDSDQDEIYNLPAPLIIIGSAGSGKTESVVFNFLQHFANLLCLHKCHLGNLSKQLYLNNFQILLV